jgi:hypothetical protein
VLSSMSWGGVEDAPGTAGAGPGWRGGAAAERRAEASPSGALERKGRAGSGVRAERMTWVRT